jgi:hypothetical protein
LCFTKAQVNRKLIMQNPDHFVQGWQVIIGKCIKMRLAFRWLLPVVMVIVALGVGFTSEAIQAQDGETGSERPITANFVLQVNAAEPKLRSLCIGESFQLPIKVLLQTIRSTVPGQIGSYTVRNAPLTATVANPSVVSAEQGNSSGPSSDAPFTTHLKLTGQEAGSTTITIKTTVESNIIVSLDEEVALPMPMTSHVGPISISVRVWPCEYRVNINSIWSTTMFGADTILIGVAHDLRLKGLPGELLQFEPEPMRPPFLQWTWAMNRIRGCNPGSGRFDQTAPSMRGTITGDKLALSLYFFPVAPPDNEYWFELCRPYHTAQPCSERPDGICPSFPPPRFPGEWEPGGLPTESADLLFPLNGGTKVISHPLIGRGGRVTGTTIITIVPVRVQP